MADTKCDLPRNSHSLAHSAYRFWEATWPWLWPLDFKLTFATEILCTMNLQPPATPSTSVLTIHPPTVSVASSKRFCFQVRPCVFSALQTLCYKSPLYLLISAVKFSRNKRKRQPIGMVGRSSGNHDWLLANASAWVSCGFRLRNVCNARKASDCVWMETGLKWVSRV